MARRLSSCCLVVLASFAALRATLCFFFSTSPTQHQAFLSSAARQPRATPSIQRNAISDAERAAVLRMPVAPSARVDEEVEEEEKVDSQEISDEMRNALRLPPADEQARLIKEIEDREYFEEMISQERSMRDGSAFGAPITAMYYLAYAACMVSILGSVYKFAMMHA